MTHTLLIYDLDVRYAIKLAEYINNDKAFPFEARFCIEEDLLEEYMKKWNVDILLVEELLYDRALEAISEDRIIVLKDNSFGIKDYEFSVFKYQNMEALIKQILKKVSTMSDIGQLVVRKNRLELYGVYSPNFSEIQTEVAMDIGRVLSRKGKTLFISMNGMSNLESMYDIGFDVDLTEILFEVCGLNRAASAVIGSHICHDAAINLSYGQQTENGKASLDILPDARCYQDLVAVSFDEWRDFFNKLENETDYEYVILDITESIPNMFGILSCCNKLYTLYSDEKNVVARNEKFVDALEHEGMEGLSMKLCSLDISFMISEEKRNYLMGIEKLMREIE